MSTLHSDIDPIDLIMEVRDGIYDVLKKYRNYANKPWDEEEVWLESWHDDLETALRYWERGGPA